jgi:F0F1-type ATP synthase assembly protein I
MDRDNLNHSRNEEGALWSIVGYLLSGLIIWGGSGWGFDQWLGTNYFLLVGMLLGAGASIYLVWLRFGRD